MMKERSWNLQGMETIEKSMDIRAKEKHEEEHEDSKREGKIQNNQSLYQESRGYQPDMKAIKQRN
jgi:hypothetical protein